MLLFCTKIIETVIQNNFQEIIFQIVYNFLQFYLHFANYYIIFATSKNDIILNLFMNYKLKIDRSSSICAIWLVSLLLSSCRTTKQISYESIATEQTMVTDSIRTTGRMVVEENDTVDIKITVSHYEVNNGEEEKPKLKSITILEYNKTHNKKGHEKTTEEKTTNHGTHSEYSTDIHELK